MGPEDWTGLLREGAVAVIAVISLRWNMRQARQIQELLAGELRRERKISGAIITPPPR